MAGPLKSLIFTPTPTLEVWPILLHQSPWWSSLVCLDPETKSREFSPPQGNEKPRVPPPTRERKAQNSLPQSLSPNNFYERVSNAHLITLNQSNAYHTSHPTPVDRRGIAHQASLFNIVVCAALPAPTQEDLSMPRVVLE